jgi:glycosyltransferase involved in cell wall biosynthesis
MADQPISVVVPVYNSAETLAKLVDRLNGALGVREYEIVLVNDGSRDASWDRIQELVATHENVRGIGLARNYGQHNALLAGIRAARNPVVVTLDDDLQNPPEEIPRLLAALEDGELDLVYGTPSSRGHGATRNVATALAKRALVPVIGKDVAQNVSAFRAFRTRLRDAFSDFRGPHVSIDALLGWSTTRIGAVPVEHHRREAGRSTYSFARLATHALTMLTAYSTRPLRIASLIGLASTLFGVFILGFVVVRYLIEGDVVPGFPFLASIIAIFSGVQLLTLGVIGEYIARMHERSMNRPPYSVRDEVGPRARREQRVGV